MGRLKEMQDKGITMTLIKSTEETNTYLGTWHVENPSYCLTCGKNPGTCDCYNKLKTRSQYFTIHKNDL